MYNCTHRIVMLQYIKLFEYYMLDYMYRHIKSMSL